MSKTRKIQEGDLVEIYRIPKKCEYWVEGMDEMLGKPFAVRYTDISDKKDFRLDGYYVPRSCVRRWKGE
jgi:hypothetical protein